MRLNYWSCSKFANWLRGTPKPPSGTIEEWDAWRKTAKAKKFRYWLAEDGLDHLQDFVNWPVTCAYTIHNYISNRWIIKRYALSSNLNRGEWHEFDTRLLHACFDELVNFIEIEQAWMQVVFSEEDRKKYKTPWYRRALRMGYWRSAAAGIAYLEWAAKLKNDENCVDKNDSSFGQTTHQALVAQETLTLYKWWKHERPKRPDPCEASGLSAYYEKERSSIKNKTKDERLQKMLNHCAEMEKEQGEEDTAMLICLVKIRQGLWT